MKAVKAATEQAYKREEQITLNLQGLEPTINGDVLSICVQTIDLSGPLVSQDVRQEMISRCGLSPLEVDVLIDNWWDELQNRTLANLLMSRRVRK